MTIESGNSVGISNRIAVGLFLVLWAITACKQSEPSPFGKGWIKLEFSPLPGAQVLEEARTSPCSWSVQADGSKVTVQGLPNGTLQRRLETRIEYAGATLIGEDHGEWGGALLVVDAAGGATRKILDENILQMFALEHGVAVITGYLPANEGSVWFYMKADGSNSSIQKKADLNGFPKVIGRSGNRILIAYGDGVSVIDSDFNNRLIAKLPILYVLPNSIVQDATGNIYVGMNAFVVRLVPAPSGYLQEWFTQRACLQ